MSLLEKLKEREAAAATRSRFRLVNMETLEVEEHDCSFALMPIHPGLNERKLERCFMCGKFKPIIKEKTAKLKRKKAPKKKQVRTSWYD